MLSDDEILNNIIDYPKNLREKLLCSQDFLAILSSKTRAVAVITNFGSYTKSSSASQTDYVIGVPCKMFSLLNSQ